MIKIVVPKETGPGEKRVALTPDVVGKFCASGHTVVVEKGAGEHSFFDDAAFTAKGALIAPDAKSLYKGAQLVAKVGPLTDKEWSLVEKNTAVVGLLGDISQARLGALSEKQIKPFGLEKLPRISRAQTMDVLSSQSTIAGYAAAIMAASKAPTLFPLLMTSAGTLVPARVFVLGAGVAGLQVIATAKRLGATVVAYDVRQEVKEQVQSLGADFLDIDLASQEGEGAGGYAKELSDKAQELQRAAIQKALERADVVITTALVPGKKAPLLLTQEMMKSLKLGALVIDMAAEMGGNCEVTVADQTILHNGVLVIGPSNMPSLYPRDASLFYAKNIFHFVQLLLDDKGALKKSLEDEVLAATFLGAAVQKERSARPS